MILGDEPQPTLSNSTAAAKITTPILQKVDPLRIGILALLFSDGTDRDVRTRRHFGHRPCVSGAKLRIYKSLFLPVRATESANRNPLLPTHD